MGMRRDAEIRANRDRRLPPSPAVVDVLTRLRAAVIELRKVLDLEISGERDGDGYWSGSDAMGGYADEVARLIAEYEEISDLEWRLRTGTLATGQE